MAKAWVGSARSFTANVVKWHHVEVRDYTMENGIYLNSTYNAGITGSIPGAVLTPHAAPVVQILSGVARRHMRGRIFVPGVAKQWWGRSGWLPLLPTRLSQYMFAIKSGISGNGFEWVLVTRFRANVPLPVAEVHPVTGYKLRSDVGSMYRRVVH